MMILVLTWFFLPDSSSLHLAVKEVPLVAKKCPKSYPPGLLFSVAGEEEFFLSVTKEIP